jgi:phosphatidylglycerol---prolipoprotein diacylglyceryl transferase
MGSTPTELAFLIDWGWLRIGPYIHINIDPVLLQIGPLALRWYGLMYVVGIVMGLWFIRRYTTRKGISQEKVYRVLWWCVVSGLIGARLYFVIQQPDLVSYYLAQPVHILATWEGGMAFYGAIFVVVPILFWRAIREKVNPLIMLDAGALFAVCGQIFGRIGNLINGDIIGYPSNLPWSTVYDNPHSWACLDPSTCHVPVQPAAGYELLLNVLMIVVLLSLARIYRRPGALMVTYLFGYAITQFLVFFERANIVVPLGPLDWGLKQAQWTSLIFFILLIPLAFFFLRTRYARPIPAGEIPATYGIPQDPASSDPEPGHTAESAKEPEQAEEAESAKEPEQAEEEESQPASVGADVAQSGESAEEGETAEGASN